MQSSLLQLFPLERRGFWEAVARKQKQLQEIRLRRNQPIILILEGKEFFMDHDGNLLNSSDVAYRAEPEEMEAMLHHICHYSLYAFEDELRQGFITVPGGHRVGIVGQVVMEQDGAIRTIKNISGLNIRISHQIRGVADTVLPFVYRGGQLRNILIISPPGCGKTTLLRDLIRQISDGNAYGKGMCVGVVDERSEIAGSYQGAPQNDIGMRTDVLDACPKAQGMMLLLRSMSPQVIAVDELGSEEDMQALRMAAFCGSKIVATMHGADIYDIFKRWGKAEGEITQLFDCYLILGREQGKPVIKERLGREAAYAAACRWNHDYSGMSGIGNVVSAAVPTKIALAPGFVRNVGDVDE